MTEATNRPNRARKKRIPLGVRSVLNAPQRKGYYRYFANDEPGNIEAMMDAGYEIVCGDIEVGENKAGKASQEGSPVMVNVGGGTKAVLMEIPEEYHKEDVEAEQAKILEKELSMKQKLNTHNDGTYGYVK